MTVARDIHERFGATFEGVGRGAFPAHFGRPERTHRAVRNVVGVTEMAYGVVVVEGGDRAALLEDVLSGRLPAGDGRGGYALVVDDGVVRADCYVYDAGERHLAFVPPGLEGDLAAAWTRHAGGTRGGGAAVTGTEAGAERGAEAMDATATSATDRFGVFGVHGPTATEKVASVLNGAGAPEGRLSFVRGRINDRGVTVVRSDDPPGEEGYEVVSRADGAPDVLEALVTYGLNAVPFGRRTWETLTLEAGTPLFDADLRGRAPETLGVWPATGRDPVPAPEARLVGLRPDAVPAPGAPVRDAAGDPVGTVTRAADCPSLEAPAAMAVVDATASDLVVDVDGERVAAARADLPFVEGGGRSARLPTWA